MKRIGAFLLVMLLTLLAGVSVAETELLENGGFELRDADGDAVGWYTNAYRKQEGYTRFEITDQYAHSGQYSAMIKNANANDSRFVCAISVEPNSLYRFAAYVRVETMETAGNGANLAVEDVYSYSERLYDTNGEWRLIEWYGETDSDQKIVELGVRVGGYGAESVGTAYFDDVSVTKLSALPNGVVASLWFTEEAQKAQSDASTETVSGKSTVLFVVLGLAFAVLAALGRSYLLREDKQDAARVTIVAFAAGLLLAFALRVWLGCTVAGYQVDINCFTAWSARMASVGPAGFYTEDYFCDYPPGYMLALWPIGLLLRSVGASNTALTLLLLKIIPILCDMVTAMLLFAYAKKRLSLKPAIFLALLYALNPAAIVNGACWGQVDSVLALFMVLTAIYAMEKRWRIALPVFVTAALMKPQALLFAPVGVLWLVMALVKDQKRQKQVKELLWGLLWAAVVGAAIIIPFSVRQTNPLWLINLYQETLSSYQYATLNTANLYYLLGGNWSTLVATEDRAPVILSWLIPLLTGLPLLGFGVWKSRLYKGFASVRALWGTRKAGNRQREAVSVDERRKTALALLLVAFGLAFVVLTCLPCTFAMYGWTWMALVYAWGLLAFLMDGDADRLPFCMALILIGVYVLGVKVHERYLFAGLALLLLAYARTRDRRLLGLCVGFSVTTFVNTAIVLDNSILFGASMGHLNSDTIALNDILCIANLLLCLTAAWISFGGVKPSAPIQEGLVSDEPTAYRNELLTPRDARMHLTGRDWLIMGVTTVLYAALAFTNLGSAKAPQNGWVSTAPDEQAVFELQTDTPTRFKLMYYAGVSYNNFSVSVSDDGTTWSEAYPCEMREGLCYRWQYALTSTGGMESPTFGSNDPSGIQWFTGKYLRLNAEKAGLNLFEILVRDESGAQIPLRLISHTGAQDVLTESKPAENLIDEQDTMSGEPGWYYGTYFDEIYHARTAYEHLHGQAPYETTHPPLGKLMMSACIAIFGMTPFGWRFAGALIGVLMLPALYLLARQLTKRRDLSTFAMLLLALDLMHFTQTRIATIDSFPVFFIILSYLCMARYMLSDAFAVPDGFQPNDKPRVITKQYLRSLIPLALCGLFMGLSIASKWIGLYSAVGLAVLFFASAYQQLRIGTLAYDVDTKGLTDQQLARVLCARELTIRRLMATCGFCLLFFIAVPALIYYLCYIPYLSPTGAVTIERIVRAQRSMLAYHSTPGLGMDHPFQSPWWQWPFILKPIWFAQDKFEPTGFAGTIMCLGNPVVFYAGAISMLVCIALYLRRFVQARPDLRLRHGDGRLEPAILIVGFLAQYLPWVLVPRSMYIYHYFASVPFIILATTMLFGKLPEERRKLRYGLMIGFVALAAVFFVLLYPYASGMLTPTGWLESMKWVSKLYY